MQSSRWAVAAPLPMIGRRHASWRRRRRQVTCSPLEVPYNRAVGVGHSVFRIIGHVTCRQLRHLARRHPRGSKQYLRYRLHPAMPGHNRPHSPPCVRAGKGRRSRRYREAGIGELDKGDGTPRADRRIVDEGRGIGPERLRRDASIDPRLVGGIEDTQLQRGRRRQAQSAAGFGHGQPLGPLGRVQLIHQRLSALGQSAIEEHDAANRSRDAVSDCFDDPASEAARNILDKKMAEFLVVGTAGVAVSFAAPATYGFTLGIEFQEKRGSRG